MDPDVSAGLAGAAVALGAPTTSLYSAKRPMPDDRSLVTAAEDHEMTAAEQAHEAARQHAACSRALDRAYQAHRDAMALLRAAEAGEANVQVHPLRAHIHDLEQHIADCEMALETLGDLAARLAYAAGCLQRVPGDLTETYEAAYRLLRFGLRLPADGDFLTGTPATPDQPSNAMA